jgi:hypothetical protein
MVLGVAAAVGLVVVGALFMIWAPKWMQPLSMEK